MAADGAADGWRYDEGKRQASCKMNASAAAGVGVALVLLLLLLRWKWRALKTPTEADCPPCTPVQLVHRLCPHSNVVLRYEVEQKDSLDEHLDLLSRKLAEKEGRLRVSKMKIRETQNEIDNLHAIDQNVRCKYRQIMDSLKNDLSSNEKECKKIQEQIEWVSRRRAELKVEVSHGQRLYGEAAAELASNLAELQRGRTDQRVIEKPSANSQMSLRHRKEPQLPRSSVGSMHLKSPLSSPLTSKLNQRTCEPESDPTFL